MDKCPGCRNLICRLPTKEEPYCGDCGCNLLSVTWVPNKEPPQLPQ